MRVTVPSFALDLNAKYFKKRIINLKTVRQKSLTLSFCHLCTCSSLSEIEHFCLRIRSRLNFVSDSKFVTCLNVWSMNIDRGYSTDALTWEPYFCLTISSSHGRQPCLIKRSPLV